MTRVSPPTDPPEDRNGSGAFATDHLLPQLKERTVRGGAHTAITQALKGGLQLAGVVVLARLLAPEDFGLVAVVTAVTGFALLFRQMGLPMATVQSPTLTHQQVNSLFWINVGMSLLLAALTAAAAPLIARVFGDDRLTMLVVVAASGFILGGLSAQHRALLRREMRFAAINQTQVVGMALGTGSAIAFAWMGLSYWALVLSQIVNGVYNAAAFWWLSPWRPGRPAVGGGIKRLLMFGGNLTAANLTTYLSKNVDNLLIGAMLGPTLLGAYSKAYSVVMLPVQHLGRPLSTVMVPAMSRLHDQPQKLANYFYRAAHFQAVVCIPLLALLALFPLGMTRLILGPQWDQAAEVFRIFALGSLAQPIIGACNWLMIATDRTGRFFFYSVVNTVILVAAFASVVTLGIEAMAWAYGAVTWAVLPWLLTLALRKSPANLMGLLRALRGPVVATAAAVGVAWFVGERVAFDDPRWLALAGGAVGAVTYFAVLAVMGDLAQLASLRQFLRPPKAAKQPEPAL